MKLPAKTIPFLFLLLLVGAFLLGRYQGQLELLRGGQVSRQGTTTQTGDQAGGQAAGQGQTQQGPNVNLSDQQWQDVVQNATYLKGDEGAPVTVVEFTDYQCPFCNRFFTETYPQVEKEYVDTGKVRYMVRDFPLPFHGNAHAAAQAARCAGDQDKYLEMHDVLFTKQNEWSSADAQESFESYAQEIGLNGSSFSECLSSAKYKDAVDQDLAMSQQLGVGGTPGFFINGKLLVGAQPFTAFQQVIDAEL
jgi:protein-disulfide isomerase